MLVVHACAAASQLSGDSAIPVGGLFAGDLLDELKHCGIRSSSFLLRYTTLVVGTARACHESAPFCDVDAEGPEMSDNGPFVVDGAARSPFFSTSSSMVSCPTLRSSAATCAS